MQFRKRSCDEGLWAFLFPSAVKNTENDRKLKDFTFQAFVKKANHLTRFDD